LGGKKIANAIPCAIIEQQPSQYRRFGLSRMRW
jgi:hypothetical protein